ncbi:MAG: formylmethanofuran dehydrogenase subunit E family protein [Candidatus Bathyarchaeota archaeon]|nr:formylmethanofuran dehydrogenase subunit E family protein [Candidatus Bathyarchaeota archaeon]
MELVTSYIDLMPAGRDGKKLVKESHEVSSELLNEAIRFHGHLGPFLILGLKAGLYANKILGKDHSKIRVIVETKLSPPYSCIIDGIQVTTGCTMGKGNITARNGESVSITFINGERSLKMRLKERVLESLKDMSTKGDSERKALKIMSEDVNDLFDISIEKGG